MYQTHFAYQVFNLIPLKPSYEVPLDVLDYRPVDYFLFKPEFLRVILAESQLARSYRFDYAPGLHSFRNGNELYVICIPSRSRRRFFYPFLNGPETAC